MQKKIIALIICFGLIVSFVFIPYHNAKAIWPTSASIANLVPEAMTTVGTFSDLAIAIKDIVMNKLAEISVSTAKVAALLAVQAITRAVIGDGGGSGAITDWNNYLYAMPQQKALAQMNTFFTTASNGRASSLNYEGVGPNYDAYLISQAKKAIAEPVFKTDIQNTVSNPYQLFDNGNMKGFMTYLKCPNNVACYTLVATEKYNSEFTKAQEIAKKEQSNGFLPKKSITGKIIQPAVLISNAFTQVDQLGTQLIMTAEPSNGSSTGALLQIAKGATISIASRSFNYLIADSKGKATLRNKNDQFPFSLSYSSTGFGVKSTTSGVTTKK